MSLAVLRVAPNLNDQRSIDAFSFSNQDEHQRLVRAIAVQGGAALTIYPLDPIPVYAATFWAQLHQQAHNDLSNALGTSLFDISEVNFSNPDEAAAWAFLHYNMHQDAANALGGQY
jgi:hypothetical protein